MDAEQLQTQRVQETQQKNNPKRKFMIEAIFHEVRILSNKTKIKGHNQPSDRNLCV